MNAVSATRLDGIITRDEIFTDLAARVEKLKAAGIDPGLGTVLVGDDPGSRSYVKGKHADCAKIGVNSIRRDLPVDATTEQLNAAIDDLNADPACTGYIVQLPLPRHLDENAALNGSTRTRMPTVCIRSTWAGWCWARRRRCPARRVG